MAKRNTKAKRQDGRQKYNQDAIFILCKKYDVDDRYVRACLRGDRNSFLADKIRREYRELEVKLAPIDAEKEKFISTYVMD